MTGLRTDLALVPHDSQAKSATGTGADAHDRFSCKAGQFPTDRFDADHHIGLDRCPVIGDAKEFPGGQVDGGSLCVGRADVHAQGDQLRHQPERTR